MERLIIICILITLLLVSAPNTCARRKDSITEITLEERSGWIGFLIKITLRSDQTAVTIQPDWEEERVRKTKTFQGEFYDFGRLAKALEAQGFFRLKDKYLAGDTDLNTVIITAVRDGVRKEVVNYGDEGPLNLWVIEHLIRSVAQRKIKWEEVPGK